MAKDNYGDITKEYVALSTRTAEALEGLKSAIHDINETNILHKQSLQENTKAVQSIERFWGNIVKWLTIGMIILAGAEKFSKLLGI